MRVSIKLTPLALRLHLFHLPFNMIDPFRPPMSRSSRSGLILSYSLPRSGPVRPQVSLFSRPLLCLLFKKLDFFLFPKPSGNYPIWSPSTLRHFLLALQSAFCSIQTAWRSGCFPARRSIPSRNFSFFFRTMELPSTVGRQFQLSGALTSLLCSLFRLCFDTTPTRKEFLYSLGSAGKPHPQAPLSRFRWSPLSTFFFPLFLAWFNISLSSRNFLSDNTIAVHSHFPLSPPHHPLQFPGRIQHRGRNYFHQPPDVIPPPRTSYNSPPLQRGLSSIIFFFVPLYLVSVVLWFSVL